MVTIGNVLPGVIVALILATFSFAIAGLIIDLGGIVTGLVAFILGDGTEISSISGLGKLMGSVFSGNVSTASIISGVTGALGIGGYRALGAGLLGLVSPVGAIVSGVIGVIGIAISVLIIGVILVGAVKVLITLYKALFSLLLNVILGPIQITLGAFPGNRHMITNWFLSVVRNVLVFPVVLFIVNLPNALMSLNSDTILRFPGKLVYEDPNTYDPSGNLNVTGGLFIFILKIFVLYFAAQAPKFLESVFPPSTSNKSVVDGMEGVKKSLSGIPLVGSLFK
jgi:hypothetical protein